MLFKYFGEVSVFRSGENNFLFEKISAILFEVFAGFIS